MNKKILLSVCVTMLLVSVIGVANAGWLFNRGESKQAPVENLVGETKEVGETQRFESELTEANHYNLIQAVPAPQLETSQERKNLVRRLQTFNSDSKISYIYLVSFGKVMAFYTVKGKVSSVNSKLTSAEQIVVSERCLDDVYYRSDVAGCFKTVESPQLDGSYGTNGNAIFFFTTESVYVEWNGEYMLADEPLFLTTPAQLVREIK